MEFYYYLSGLSVYGREDRLSSERTSAKASGLSKISPEGKVLSVGGGGGKR